MYSYQQTASGQQRPGGDETRPHTLNSRNEILYIAIPEVYPFRYLMMMIHITQTRTKKNTPRRQHSKIGSSGATSSLPISVESHVRR